MRRPRAAVRRAMSMLAAGALLAGMIPVAAAPAAVAAATPAAVSTTVDQFGYPDWYQDTTGTRVEPCLNVNDPFCTVLPNPGVFDPALAMDLPVDFPDEFFYAVADSETIATPGCAGTRPGKALLRVALEGAFLNGLPADNEQMVFGRVRVRVSSGLCPNTAYTFTHPYGSVTLTTDEAGGIKPVVGTTDIGCLGFFPPQKCDFSQALSSPVATSFPRWDPAVAPASPAGYLGDAATLHAITGGTYVPAGAPGAVNYFAISNAGGEVARTDLFTVMGKEAGPLLAATAVSSAVGASTTFLDFGGQNINTGQSAPRIVTVTNVGAAALTVSAISAAPALRFNVVPGSTCLAAPLARDASCTVGVTFDPTVVGELAGTLTITHDQIRSPLLITLAGTGTNPGNEAILTANPLSLSFGSVRIRTTSLAQRVRVTNTGVAPLTISSIAFLDTTQSGDAVQFIKTADKCLNAVVQPRKTCDISVAVRPESNGALSAVMRMTANIAIPQPDGSVIGHVDIALSAIGTGGIAAVSPVIDAATGYPTWYQDEMGLRLSECIDPKDPFCIVLGDDFFDPALPLEGRPDFANFPTEFFYTVSDSDQLITPGCPATATTPAIAPGRAFVRSALEAAFVNPAPTDGDQMVFGRNRIVVRGGLCPNSTYTFTHPYGQTILKTDGSGSIKPAAGTTDIGCFPVAPTLCSFSDALQSPVLAGFLQWDPAVAPAAPAGYLGDAASLHRVTGSPYQAPGETVPANYFRIQGPTSVGGASSTIGQTTLFTVMGKLNGPLVANPSSVAFAPETVGVTGANNLVTLTNEGIASLTINSLVLGGANAADFVADSGCGNAFFGGTLVLAPGASCTFNVAFAPTGVGSRVAAITVNHTGRNSGFKIGLQGVGKPASGPAISVSPASFTFADLHVGQASQSLAVSVSNLGGLEPLEVGTPTIDNAADFQVTNLCPAAPATVAIDESCTITVRFTPEAAGHRSGTITIPSNVAGAVTTVVVGGHGFAGAPAVSATTTDGFPDWYQDDNGVRVQPCLDAADPNCIVLGDAGFDPAKALNFPTNFPSEFFYQIADSDLVPTDGCAGTTAPGTASLRVALEGSFAGGSPAAGQQTTFARSRVVVTRGLCANTSYTFTTPYGSVGPFLTNSVGGIPANAGTTDTNPPIPSPLLDGGLLRWDPAVAPAAPAGYLGDAISLHRVVGSRYVAPGDTEPANYFAIDGTAMRTDQFFVSGHLAGPIVDSPASLDFGNVNVGLQSSDQTFTLTNVSSTPVTGFASSLTGTDASQFAVTGGTCLAATVLDLDQSCTVTVKFAPTVAGGKSALLGVAHSGLNSPADVLLVGQAIDVPRPAVSLSPASVAFASQNVGTVSAATAITVTNTGTADLHVTSATLVGTNPGDFQLTSTCLTVIPGGTCTLQARFAPTAAGTRTAQVQLVDDAPTSPQLVNLSGTGLTTSLSVSPTSLAFNNIGVGGSSTKTVSITNTGTGNLNIGSLTITGSTTFTIASHTCTAPIAPGKNCGVNVRFAPTSATLFTGTLNIVSNATGSPHAVALSGTGK